MIDIDDLDLMGPVSEVDEFLLSFCIKNKFPALMVTSVILARLVWLNKQSGSTEDFTKLLLSVVESIDNKEFDKPIDKKLH
jgi:exoribonuclease R